MPARGSAKSKNADTPVAVPKPKPGRRKPARNEETETRQKSRTPPQESKPPSPTTEQQGQVTNLPENRFEEAAVGQLRQVSYAMLMSDPVTEFNEENRDKGSIPSTQEGLFDSGFLFEPSASQKTTR